jgi:hypothetical protein
MAEAIISLRFDDQQRKQLAENARHRAETTFRISRAATELGQFWKETARLSCG